MKTFILGVFLFCVFLFSSSYLGFTRSINVSQTFTSDTTINIFSQNDTAWGIKLNGSIRLLSDTSLVRLIFVDEDELEYMVYEAYALIVDTLSFSVENACDETCYLDGLIPSGLRIEIINGQLRIDSILIVQDYVENAPTLQYSKKRESDALKIEYIKQNIIDYELRWYPGDNDLVSTYYYEKKELFGEKYHLLGYDYYDYGIYERIGFTYASYTNNPYVNYWDWRGRHSANQIGSPYYDGDDSVKSGWMTSVKNQGLWCGACAAFATIGVVEGMTNLYFNQHLDFDLSEQELISCAPTGSCTGADPARYFQFIEDYGIVSEHCFSYLETDTIDCDTCSPADTLIFIAGHDTLKDSSPGVDLEDLQLELITRGPLAWYKYLGYSAHEVVLIGYIYNEPDDELILIYKDSQGVGVVNKGFVYEPAPAYFNYVLSADVPITEDTPSPDTVLCLDEDGDGYYNWGIGPKPPTSDSCPNEPDCDDSNPNLGPFNVDYSCDCNSSYYMLDTIYITSDTSWTGINTLGNPLIIKDNGKLTLTGTLFMPRFSLIYIEPGGQLILDSARITKACNHFWEGIQVWGDSSLSQQPNSNQGYIEIKNGSSIEYAKVGVLLGRRKSTSDSLAYSGGIIMSKNSQFLNNIVDIEFLPYSDGNTVNYSRIKNSDFITNDVENILFEPDAHIKVDDIYNLYIEGCTFRYTIISGLQFAEEKRGTGILSYDGGLLVKAGCQSPQGTQPCQILDSCRFENLRYGIRAFNTGKNRVVQVHESVFKHNLTSCYLSGFSGAEITSSDFYSSPAYVRDNNMLKSSNTFYGGIYLDGCTGYQIENNSFTGVYMFTMLLDITQIGIYIKDSGEDDNEIYDNYFASICAGIVVEGVNKDENTGLCLKCNDYYQCMNDMIVVPNYTESNYIGIREMQGSDDTLITAPAGNTFTLFYVHYLDSLDNGGAYKSFWNYLNYSDDIIYYHHEGNLNPLTYPYDDNYTHGSILLDEQPLLEYSKEQACPSNLTSSGTKNYINPRMNMSAAQLEIDYYQGQLDLLVDGGNTNQLNADVMFSIPDEALEIRSQLMDESPYLSDTVMKQAIEKENVLPNAMIRDVLVANPQSAKSENILKILDYRSEPMPDYMMSEIMQGKSLIGNLESMESKLGYWKLERKRAMNDLIMSWMTDTIQYFSIDSLINLYQEEEDLLSKYRLTFSHIDNNDFSSANLVLGNIPSNYQLDSYQNEIFEAYDDYLDVLQNMNSQNLGAKMIDSVMILELYRIKNLELPLISAYCRGQLVKGGHLNYTETVNFPDNTKSNRIYNDEYGNKKNKDDRLLKLFPNPAGDFVILYYCLSAYNEDGMIYIHDVQGRVLDGIKISNSENQMTINISKLKNGIYYFSLYLDNGLKETLKLIKGRY
ncbi:MAG: C1 family peptidase [Bacteroidales bacterium]